MHAPDHGWRLLFPDRHPFAGGDDHYAAYLENREGYEVELVAPGRPDGRLAGAARVPAGPALPGDRWWARTAR